MKMRFLFVALLSLALLCSTPQQALADTSSAGQLLLLQDGSTMYLTTEPQTSATGEQVVVTTRSVDEVSDITPPEAFASDIGEFISTILTFVFVIASLMVFVYLVWAGIDWITSGGDKGKTDKARQKIVAAIVGLIIILASYAVVNLVTQYFAQSTLNEVLQTLGTEGRVTTTATPSATPNNTPN